MARFLATKVLSSLRPVDEAGEEILRGIGKDELVKVEIKRPRNIHHHRMFWALMSIVWQNMDGDRYPTVEDLVDAVKIATGHRKRIELPSGEVGFIPKSIAFHRMSQDEFSAFYNRICDLLANHFLPGVTNEQLRQEVEILIGVRA